MTIQMVSILSQSPTKFYTVSDGKRTYKFTSLIAANELAKLHGTYPTMVWS